MTVLLTIISGVVVFVLGQLVVKLVIDPVADLRTTIAEISHALVFHAEVYSNPGITGEERERATKETLRRLSSDLNAAIYLIPAYAWTSRVFALPSRAEITEAAGQLIELSNSVSDSPLNHGIENFSRYQKICTNLGIYLPEGERPNDAEI